MKIFGALVVSLWLAGCAAGWQPPDPDRLMAAALAFQAGANGMTQPVYPVPGLIQQRRPVTCMNTGSTVTCF